MIKKLFIYCLLLITLFIFNGCSSLTMPDQFKWEAGVDQSGKYNGMKTGFSWNLPQPK
jgi:hypothetical protein